MCVYTKVRKKNDFAEVGYFIPQLPSFLVEIMRCFPNTNKARYVCQK